MKRFLILTLSFLLLATLFFIFPNELFAKEKKKKDDTASQQTIKAVNNEGETNIYGSVLDPNVNQVLLLLPKPLLNIIRKMGLSKLSVNVTSALDSTKTFTLPVNAINIQRKRIKGVSGKYLIVNFSNLTTPSEVTVTPSTLPTGDYRIRIAGTELNAATETFNYQTPILIVGIVKSKDTGFITVEDLGGNVISDKTVAISPNGTFLTEVRADKIKSQLTTITRKKKAQEAISDDENDSTENNENEEETKEEIKEVNTGLVHAVTDKDLFAVVPLDNDVKSNTAISNKPIELSEGSTLTANLGKKYEPLANEIAKSELEKLESEEETSETFEDFGCDIFQFASRCTSNDEEEIASIGQDFKNFIASANCNFPGFNLLKNFISNSPDDANLFIGLGYCENVGNVEDEDKPCEAYSQVLSNFKSGVITQLPCPPEFCAEFNNIKPPRCVKPVEFCKEREEENFGLAQTCTGPSCKLLFGKPTKPSCVIKPVKDVFCARIGVDITEEDCRNHTNVDKGIITWSVSTSSQGNEFCVPANFSNNKIVEECEIRDCHRQCEEEFGSSQSLNFTPGNFESGNCKVCDCHIKCDIEGGKVVDCNPKSKNFSMKCCNSGVIGPVIFTQSTFSTQFTGGGSFSGGGFGGGSFSGGNFSGGNFGFGKGPILHDIRGCLCSDPANFNEKSGLIQSETLEICKDSCPEGFEKDPNNDICLPICEAGLIRDPNGICRKKCPQGFIQDEFNNCRCPKDQFIGQSDKCETLSCPIECKNNPLVRKFLEQQIPSNFGKPDFSSPQGTFGSPQSGTSHGPGFGTGDISNTSIPPKCSGCFGVNVNPCPHGQQKDPATGQCVQENECGVDQYLDTNRVCRCNASGQIATSLGPEGCKKQNNCGSNMLPNNVAGEAQCICPTGLPYWDGTKCVAQCPNGNPPPSASSNLLPKSPIPCNSSLLTCAAGEIPSQTNCSCASPGYTTGINTPCTCPPGYNIAYSSLGCGTILRNCAVGEKELPLVCKCASGAAPTGPNGICQCTNGQGYTLTGCGTSSTNYCAPGVAPTTTNPCICAPGGIVVAPGGPCQCTNSQVYTVTGCNPPSTNCGIGQSPTSNSCTCAPPATPTGSNGTCQCPSGQPYSAAGCGPYTIPFCAPGQVNSTTFPCSCPSGAAPTGPSGTCQCTNGQPYTGTVCTTTTRTCAAGEIPNTNNCVCASGATSPTGTTVCTCTNGQGYTPTGCGTTTQSTASITSAVINGTNLAVTFSTNFPSDGSCAYLKDINGVTLYSLFCGSTTGTTINAPISTFPHTVIAGDQVKICKSNDSAVCSPFISVTSSAVCTSPKILDTATNTCKCPTGQVENTTTGACEPESVTLTSVVINGSNVTVTYGKNFSTCAHLKDINNNLLHTQNLFCSIGTSIAATNPLSQFTSGLQNGVQVKLCHGNNGNLCSQLVAVSGGTVPTAPSGLTATLSGSNINLTWVDNSTNETEFKVYRRPFGGTTWTFVGSTATSITSYTDTGLSAGTYEYHVNACNASGCSADSNIASATVALPAITLNSVTISSGNVTISFSVDPNTCLLVKDANNNTLKSANLCGVGSFNSVFPTSDFTPPLVSGTQVKLCNQNNSNNCSNLVAVTGN